MEYAKQQNIKAREHAGFSLLMIPNGNRLLCCNGNFKKHGKPEKLAEISSCGIIEWRVPFENIPGNGINIIKEYARMM